MNKNKIRDVNWDENESRSTHSNSSCIYDDDNDSLSCVLNDYNQVFYDVPVIKKESVKTKNKMKELKSKEKLETFINEENCKTSSSGIEDDEDTHFELKYEQINHTNSNSKTKSYIQKDSVYFENLINNDNDAVNDGGIDLEFEIYLNEENDLDKLVGEGSENFEKFQKEVKSKKIKLEKSDFGSISELKKMALGKYGFVNKRFRRKAWPILIANRDKYINEPKQKNSSKKSRRKSKREDFQTEELNKNEFNLITQEQIKDNKYFNQVTLDVVRTLKRFPSEISENLRFKLQNELIDLICRILVKHKNLHYYQGYHDIGLTFLLVTGVEESLPLLESLTLSHLTCFMEPNMESTLKLLFNILPLVDIINPEMAAHIQKAELGVIFCLSWLITWYSHVMDNLQIILRLYDFFIVSDPLMPVYLGAIIVSERAEEILSIDCDMASLHTVISKYPSQIDNIDLMENYISKTIKLFEEYPPNSLEKLNDKWLEKCKSIQLEKERFEKEYMDKIRRRRLRENSSDDEDGTNKALSKRNNMNVAKTRPKKFANKIMLGFTFTVGVAAVAMYAMNGHPKEPQEIISKVFQLLSYRDMI